MSTKLSTTNNKTNNKMETRNISLTLEEAKEWYNSNIILRDVALKAFTKEELESSFRDIKTFEDACNEAKFGDLPSFTIINSKYNN